MHSMLQVANGLSKNPHMTIERKREHLRWYRRYFDEQKMADIERLEQTEEEATSV